MLKRSRRDGKNKWKNCTKKILMTWIITNGVVSHSEPDILECEVKWTFSRSTALIKLVDVMKFQQNYSNP